MGRGKMGGGGAGERKHSRLFLSIDCHPIMASTFRYLRTSQKIWS